jgi:hypothetical protein
VFHSPQVAQRGRVPHRFHGATQVYWAVLRSARRGFGGASARKTAKLMVNLLCESVRIDMLVFDVWQRRHNLRGVAEQELRS